MSKVMAQIIDRDLKKFGSSLDETTAQVYNPTRS